MAKANSVVSLDKTASRVTVTVQGFAPIMVDRQDLKSEINSEAWAHGIGQKLVDSAALSRDPKTGKPADPAAKYAAIRATADQLMAGEWNAERESGATSILFEALCLAYPGQGEEAIHAALNGMTDAEKREFPFDPEIAPFYKQVRDARNAKLAKGVDTAAVKARLFGGDKK